MVCVLLLFGYLSQANCGVLVTIISINLQNTSRWSWHLVTAIREIGVSPKHVLISLCKLQKQDEAKLAGHPGKLAW